MIEYFQVEKEGKFIRGMLNKPDNISGKAPCLIYSHGFTGSRVEPHFFYVKIARELEKLGIVSLRFDFLGSGESDGEFDEMTLSTEVEDCEAVIKYARSLDFVDNNNINLLGFSMGGAVSILTAARHADNIKNLILISPAANMLDVMIRDLKGDKIKTYLERQVIDFQGNILSKKAVDDVWAINIYQQLKAVKSKVLAIHGTEDQMVPPFTSLKTKELLGSQCDLHLIEGADHWYSSGPFETELISIIKNFCQTHLIS